MDIHSLRLPVGWEIKPMSNVVTWASGGTPKASEKEYYENGNIPWLVIGDLNDGVVAKSQTKITEAGLNNSSAKMIPPNTLLVAMYGSIGKLGITGVSCCTNQAIAFAKELHSVSTKYMFYYMAMMKSTLISLGKGGTQKNISQSVLKSLDVIVPPLEEQSRIVARIDELFSELDKAVDTLKTTKEQLAVYRQAVLNSSFRDLERNYKLKDISQSLSGYAFKSKLYTPAGKYAVVKIGNVKAGYFDFTKDLTRTDEVNDKILEKYLLKKGDCLITLTGTRGKRDYGYVSMVEKQVNFLLNQRVAALRFDSQKCYSDFYKYYLSSSEYRNQFFKYETGNVGQGNVGIKALSEPLVPLPPMKKQKEIVCLIEKHLSVCDSIEKTVDTALAQADAMRQSILKQAFEGKL